MANHEESNPLLTNPVDNEDTTANHDVKKPVEPTKLEAAKKTVDEELGPAFFPWTADGLPLGHGSVVGEPVARSRWNSGLFGCLGQNDEFCGSDIEVCVLGTFAPCMLYGSNVERLGQGPGSFVNHCLSYAGLFMIGNSLFGSNWLAPWFSYPSRVAIRRRFNLEGNCEALSRTCGCCESIIEDDLQREQCESVCDFATHFVCHQCSLCQEGRELRRRLPHPGHDNRPVLVMIPPTEQSMGRDGT